MESVNHSKNYKVRVTKLDGARALAQAGKHRLTLNIQKGAKEAGFNAAETLLAALGACMMTNVNAIGQKMRLNIEDVQIEFDAVRSDEPAILTEIDFKLIVTSQEPEEKLAELYNLSVKWGTVVSTVKQGLTPNGSLVIRRSEPQAEQ